MRRHSRKIWVGDVPVGGNAPVSVQSMTNTRTTDVKATLDQIERMRRAGVRIVRLALPDAAAVAAFERIKGRSPVPLVADIHFDYKLALAAVDAGADKIRINPGNIGGEKEVRAVVEKAVRHNIPIRVGVNSGSIEKRILEQEGGATVRALVRSALENAALCQRFGARDIVLSLKSSDVQRTIRAYEEISKATDLPLHIGVTEAGTPRTGIVRSAVALGILLNQGVGDTLRISLTGDPVEEVRVGLEILKSLNLISRGVTLISCPTCGRTEVDLIPIVERVEEQLMGIDKVLTVAIMGCVVNGPGEAREADIGVACGKKSAVLFEKGRVIKKVAEGDIVDELVQRVRSWKDNHLQRDAGS